MEAGKTEEISESSGWHCIFDNGPPEIFDKRNNLIATLGPCSDERVLGRASLIMAAPQLYEMVITMRDVFEAMAKQEDNRFTALARDLLPYLQDAIDGANLLGTVTPDVLPGQ